MKIYIVTQGDRYDSSIVLVTGSEERADKLVSEEGGHSNEHELEDVGAAIEALEERANTKDRW